VDTVGLEALRAELVKERAPLASIIEGLHHDLKQEDLSPDDRTQVQELLEDYVRRESLMDTTDARALATFDAVTALLQDGYPELPVREIDPETWDALEQNRKTIELALAQFRRRAITTEGRSEIGPEEPQPEA
jgi:hypothetical protein